MNKFSNFLHCLDPEKTPFCESYYSFHKMYSQLLTLEDMFFDVQNFFINPYYIKNGYRYEYYEYELLVEIAKNPSFEKYILHKTQRQRIQDVPKDILLRTRECYIEIAEEKSIIPVNRLIRYILFLFHSEPVKDQAILAFGDFDPGNLLFTFDFFA